MHQTNPLTLLGSAEWFSTHTYRNMRLGKYIMILVFKISSKFETVTVAG
jgi:hypothetical protein